ncbi:MAG: hypothetical protein IJ777_03560 [Clostridia bacterium]|nr:hypothetical protein [Clostridia bacterium]MBR1803023.1 hypothetical protein [Clostridia bacterium]
MDNAITKEHVEKALFILDRQIKYMQKEHLSTDSLPEILERRKQLIEDLNTPESNKFDIFLEILNAHSILLQEEDEAIQTMCHHTYTRDHDGVVRCRRCGKEFHFRQTKRK